MVQRIKEGKLKPGEKAKVKLSGDGAKMTQLSNFQLLSFSILQTGETVMSAQGNITICLCTTN